MSEILYFLTTEHPRENTSCDIQNYVTKSLELLDEFFLSKKKATQTANIRLSNSINIIFVA